MKLKKGYVKIKNSLEQMLHLMFTRFASFLIHVFVSHNLKYCLYFQVYAMSSVNNLDIFEITLKETALEGLDGITLPTLWKRLMQRELKIPAALSEPLKHDLWDFLVHHPNIQFFSLPEDREEPDIFNRYMIQTYVSDNTVLLLIHIITHIKLEFCCLEFSFK